MTLRLTSFTDTAPVVTGQTSLVRMHGMVAPSLSNRLVRPDPGDFSRSLAGSRPVERLITEERLMAPLRILCEHPREADRPGYSELASWMGAELEAAGGHPLGDRVGAERSFLQQFQYKEVYGPGETVTSANVIGYLPGTGPGPRRKIFLMAHPDGLSAVQKEIDRGKGRDLSSYQGANDNAAAVAAVIQVFSALKSTGPHLWDVVAFLPSAEEEGKKGSEAFGLRPNMTIPPGSRALNLEMIASPGRDLVLYTGPSAEGVLANPLTPLLGRLAHDEGIPVKDGLGYEPEKKWWRRSDHEVFHNMGLHAAMIFGGSSGAYHTEHDDLASLNLPKLVHAARLAYLATHALANDRSLAQPLRAAEARLNSHAGAVWPGLVEP